MRVLKSLRISILSVFGALALSSAALALPLADHHGKNYALKGVYSDSSGKKGTWTSEVHIGKTSDDPRAYRFEEKFKTSSGFEMDIVFTIQTQENGFFTISDEQGGEGSGHCHGQFCQFTLSGPNGSVTESWQMGPLFFGKQGFMTGTTKSVRWSGWGRVQK